jgi:hypothetical protein
MNDDDTIRTMYKNNQMKNGYILVRQTFEDGVLTKPSHATVSLKSFIFRSTYSLSQAANGLIAVLIESGGKIHVLGARGRGVCTTCPT